MFIAKPQPKGAVTNLDVNDKDIDVVDLTVGGAELIPFVGPGPFANPDGAVAKMDRIPSVTQIPGNGAPIRTENVSGMGVTHPSAVNTVPKMRP